MRVRLYHFWSSNEAQRVRLALGCKGITWDDHPLGYFDDETFFDLGVSRSVPLLVMGDDPPLTDSLDILWRIDELFPGPPCLTGHHLDDEAWRGLLAWRQGVDSVLERLYAPIRIAFGDLAGEARGAYQRDVHRRFGMSLEALANDRYDGFAQLARLSRLEELARHLARERFYSGKLSVADTLLAADLFPLQLHDGISLPVDLMYYLDRVQSACGTRLDEGLLASFM